MADDDVARARAEVLRTFRWHSGHADIWRVFADAEAFAAVVAGLVAPWRGRRVTHVVGLESRGFLLGGAAALALGAGFVAVRKTDALFPAASLSTLTGPDYRGRRHELRMQPVLDAGDRVLLVDDWAERGAQALAAAELIGRGGATLLGVSLVVDQLPDTVRADLGAVTSIVRAVDLGPP